MSNNNTENTGNLYWNETQVRAYIDSINNEVTTKIEHMRNTLRGINLSNYVTQRDKEVLLENIQDSINTYKMEIQKVLEQYLLRAEYNPQEIINRVGPILTENDVETHVNLSLNDLRRNDLSIDDTPLKTKINLLDNKIEEAKVIIKNEREMNKRGLTDVSNRINDLTTADEQMEAKTNNLKDSMRRNEEKLIRLEKKYKLILEDVDLKEQEVQDLREKFGDIIDKYIDIKKEILKIRLLLPESFSGSSVNNQLNDMKRDLIQYLENKLSESLELAVSNIHVEPDRYILPQNYENILNAIGNPEWVNTINTRSEEAVRTVENLPNMIRSVDIDNALATSNSAKQSVNSVSAELNLLKNRLQNDYVKTDTLNARLNNLLTNESFNEKITAYRNSLTPTVATPSLDNYYTKAEIDAVTRSINANITTRVSSLRGDLSDIINGVDSKVNTLKRETSNLSTLTNNLDSARISLNRLHTRVSELNTLVETQNTNTNTAITNSVNTINTSITEIHNKIDELKASIQTEKARITELTTRVNTLATETSRNNNTPTTNTGGDGLSVIVRDYIFKKDFEPKIRQRLDLISNPRSGYYGIEDAIEYLNGTLMGFKKRKDYIRYVKYVATVSQDVFERYGTADRFISLLKRMYNDEESIPLERYINDMNALSDSDLYDINKDIFFLNLNKTERDEQIRALNNMLESKDLSLDLNTIYTNNNTYKVAYSRDEGTQIASLNLAKHFDNNFDIQLYPPYLWSADFIDILTSGGYLYDEANETFEFKTVDQCKKIINDWLVAHGKEARY